MTLPSFPRRPIFRHHSYLTFTLLLLFHLLPGPTWAQTHTPTSSDPSMTDTPTISRSTAVIILILITSFFFMGFVSLYIRHCSDDDSAAARRDAGGSVFRTRRASRGLHPDIIETFPIFTYAAVKDLKFGKYALECAVCLTEFDDDDSLRLLPHCDHVFHPECVDTWLQAHTTCPVCRADLHVPHAPPAELSVHLEVAAAEEEERENHNQNQSTIENPSMEQPLRRDPTVVRRNASFGRVWGRFARSFSTGHVAVKQWENLDRFRLRLPEEVRKEVMNGKLQRAASMVVQPTSRTGYAGEGSSRGRSRSIRSDRWVFSFFSKTLSFKSPKPAPVKRQSSLRGSMQAESTRLPI